MEVHCQEFVLDMLGKFYILKLDWRVSLKIFHHTSNPDSLQIKNS